MVGWSWEKVDKEIVGLVGFCGVRVGISVVSKKVIKTFFVVLECVVFFYCCLEVVIFGSGVF